MTYRFNIIFENDETNGYYVYCPELPGCQSQGDTYEQAYLNIKEAAELYIETLTEEEKRSLGKKRIILSDIELDYA